MRKMIFVFLLTCLFLHGKSGEQSQDVSKENYDIKESHEETAGDTVGSRKMSAIVLANLPKLVEYNGTVGQSLHYDIEDSTQKDEKCDLMVQHHMAFTLPLLVDKKGFSIISNIQGSYLTDYSEGSKDSYHNISLGATALWRGELFRQKWMLMGNGNLENIGSGLYLTGSGSTGIAWIHDFFGEPIMIGVIIPFGPNRLQPIIPLINHARFLGDNDKWLLNLNIPRETTLSYLTNRSSRFSTGIKLGSASHFTPKYSGRLELRDITIRPHVAYEKKIKKMLHFSLSGGYAIPFNSSWGNVGYDSDERHGEFSDGSPYVGFSLFLRPTKETLKRKQQRDRN